MKRCLLTQAAPALAAALLAPAVAPAQVELRGSAEAVEGAVRIVSIEGVTVRRGSEAMTGAAAAGDEGRVIGWDLVRAVRGHEEAAAEFAALAEKAWRARSRLERGDWAAAEPLFEELSRAYRGVGGPTAAVVHEGLLRCRLRRGAQGAAVWAWLDWIGTLGRARGEAHRWMGGRTSLGAVRDPATDLVPGLPPIWVGGGGGQALGAVAGSEEWSRFTAVNDPATDLAALYRHAAAFEAGAASALPRVDPGHAGVRLVSEVVTARTGQTVDERKLAREKLSRRVAAGGGANVVPPEPWVEAWCRAGLGRSLVMEADADMKRRGVRELLHVPARFAEDHPYLAGVCLAEAAGAMLELGERDAGAALVEELRRRFPGHPALAWEKLRGAGVVEHNGGGARGNGSGPM